MRRLALLLAWALMATATATAAAAAAAPSGSGPPVTVQQTEEGPVWATAAGMTLYTANVDAGHPGKSVCTRERATTGISGAQEVLPLPAVAQRRSCVDKWPPLIAAPDAAPQGPWSLAERDDGTHQWAYLGPPLYASSKDRRPGDVNGLGFFQHGAAGGRRLAFAPLGFPPGIRLVRTNQGLVLAAANGTPLYVRRGAQRVCSGCAEALQPVLAPALGPPSVGDWSTLALVGARQYAFKGRGLYALPPGADRSQVGPDWAPALWRPSPPRPAAVTTQWTVAGVVYATRAGMTLYVFACDAHGSDGLSCDEPGDAAAFWSAICGMECLQRWRPYLAPPGASASGDWSVVDVPTPLFSDAEGVTYTAQTAPATVRAWAYRGRPVFTYADDDEPGQMLGHRIKYLLGGGFYAIQLPDQDADIAGGET